jgi:hypothetical protein
VKGCQTVDGGIRIGSWGLGLPSDKTKDARRFSRFSNRESEAKVVTLLTEHFLSFVKNKAVHLANTHTHTHTEQNRRTNVTSKTREKRKKLFQTLFSFFYIYKAFLFFKCLLRFFLLSLIFGVDHVRPSAK